MKEDVKKLIMQKLEESASNMQNRNRPPLSAGLGQALLQNQASPQDLSYAKSQQDQMQQQANEEEMVNMAMGAVGGNKIALQGVAKLRSIVDPKRFQEIMAELQTMAAKSKGNAGAMDSKLIDRLADLAAEKIKTRMGEETYKLGQTLKQNWKNLGASQKLIAGVGEGSDWSRKEILSDVLEGIGEEGTPRVLSKLDKYLSGKYGEEGLSKIKDKYMGSLTDFTGNLRNMESEGLSNIISSMGAPPEAARLGVAVKRLEQYEGKLNKGKPTSTSDIAEEVLSLLGSRANGVDRVKLEQVFKTLGIGE